MSPAKVHPAFWKSHAVSTALGHVHDELIIEVPESTDLKTVCDIMGKTPPWAPGLLLRADGYECAFYKKD